MYTNKIIKKIIKPSFINNCCLTHYSIKNSINIEDMNYLQLKICIYHPGNIDANLFFDYFNSINELKLFHNRTYNVADDFKNLETEMHFKIFNENIISKLTEEENYSNKIYDYICQLIDLPIESSGYKFPNSF